MKTFQVSQEGTVARREVLINWYPIYGVGNTPVVDVTVTVFVMGPNRAIEARQTEYEDVQPRNLYRIMYALNALELELGSNVVKDVTISAYQATAKTVTMMEIEYIINEPKWKATP